MPSSINDAAADSMSSPDPLNDVVPSSVARVTRSMARGYQSSLRSQRQSSTTSSPRKQTFELDVGNELSPQKILVTVEAEGGEKDHVTRRLFPSSTVRGPRSAARRRDLTTSTTTTTIPLRGLTDDEREPVPGTATPRRRGRPRKSGTPMPSSKKRAGTPIDRSPNRNRRLRSGTADSASETGGDDADATPRPAAKFRKTPGRQGRTPSTKDTRPPKETGTVKKRGRPRRQALVPAEMEALADQDTLIDTIPSAIPTEHMTEDLRPDDTRLSSIDISTDGAAGNAMGDEDIWLAAVPRSGPAADAWRASSSVVDRERRLSQQEMPRAADLLISEASSPHDRASVGYAASGADRSDADIDTIAQGEDFSMILMDSIVSFRESMQYAEAALPEMGDATSLIVDRALEPIRQGRTDKTQGHSPSRQQERSDHIQRGEGDTSSVKPEATAPAVQTTTTEPGRIVDAPRDDTSLAPANANDTTILSINSPRRGKNATPLSRQLALKSLKRDESLLEAPVASCGQEVHASPEEPSVYDDSFSEIPEGVLDAATPRPLRQHRGLLLEQADEVEGRAEDHERDNGHDEGDDHDGGEGSMEHDEKAQSAEPASMVIDSAPPPDTASKLLTPDETPPPADEEALVMASDDGQDDELRSSPPALAASADETSCATSPVIARDTRKDSTESPEAAARSSPLSPRQGQDGRSDNLNLPSLAARPALSPIVRVGRALQHVTSDPPSPKGAESALGSPFRSSVSRDIEDPDTAPPGVTSAPSPEPPNQDAAPEPSSVMRSERSWTQVLNPLSQIKSLVSQGAQMFSPRTMAPQAAAEDPFAPDSEMPSPKAVPRRKRPSIPLEEAGLESTIGSTRAAREETEDAMDWEAPETVMAVGSQRAQVFHASNTATSSGPVSGHMDDLRRHHSGLGDDTVTADVPVEEERLSQGGLEPPEADEDDDDIWAFEASRPTPSPAKPLPVQDPTLNLWSRAKLPSPWAKTATPRVASESEEFSLLSVQERDLSQASLPRPREQPVAVQMARTSAARVDLSNFFSSPAAVPRLQPFAAGGTDEAASSQPIKDSHKQLLGSVNPPLQQAVARESIAAGSASQDQNPPSSVAQKAFQPNGQRRLDLFSPAPPRQPHVSDDARPSALSQRAPPKPLFPQLPQKRNFAPHLGSSGGWMFAPVSSGAANHSASAEDTVEHDERRHESSDAEPDEHESSFAAPTLKPLPNRAASPAKSCLRSPLKPKTPGRVVEFTSSTLSPLGPEQARALHGLPLAAGGSDAMDLDLEPVQIAVQRPAGVDSAKGNKNRCPSTSFGNSKPIPALRQSVVLAPPTGAAVAVGAAAPHLSQTQWSRAHWVRMDALLQERRKGSLNFQLQHRVSVSQKRRSVALLGKHVSAQGESMALDQWHLDVVDAFRTELGAGCVWDEHVLSKRLFALLVGEERRRAAKGGRLRPLGTLRSGQAN